MHVSSFCGCCSVSVGVFIIGSMAVISSVLSIVVMAIQRVFIVAAYVPYTVYLLCGVSVIVGVTKRKSKFIHPMRSVLFVSMISRIPFGVVHFIEMSVLYGTSAKYFVGILFLVTLGVGFLIYTYAVVDTFYKKLLREDYTGAKSNEDPNVNLSNKPSLQHVQ